MGRGNPAKASGSDVFVEHVDRALPAEPLEMLGDPGIRRGVAEIVQMLQERPLGVDLAERPVFRKLALGADLVEAYRRVALVVESAALDQARYRGDAEHLAHEAGVERHLVDAVEDV